jgi:hypothetical protein
MTLAVRPQPNYSLVERAGCWLPGLPGGCDIGESRVCDRYGKRLYSGSGYHPSLLWRAKGCGWRVTSRGRSFEAQVLRSGLTAPSVKAASQSRSDAIN